MPISLSKSLMTKIEEEKSYKIESTEKKVNNENAKFEIIKSE